MSRALFLKLAEREVIAKCDALGVRISALETLPDGGTRLVCMSVNGAHVMRTKLKSKLISGVVERSKVRPRAPLW